MTASRRTRLALWLLVTGLISATIAIAAKIVGDQQQAAIAGAHALTERLARGAEASLNRSLIGIDLTLSGMASIPGIIVQGGTGVDPRTAQQALRGTVDRSLLFTNLMVVDASCRPLASAEASALRVGSGMPDGFCRAVLGQQAPQLSISDPVQSAATGDHVLFFARPLQLADGERLIAVAELPLLQITSLMSQSLEITGLSITMERDDGMLLATYPPNDPRVGTRLSDPLSPASASGIARGRPGRLDGADAIVAVRPTVYRSPMVAVGIARAAVLAEVARERNTVLVTSGLFILVSLAVGVLTQRYLRRSAQATAEIGEAKALLDQALASMADGFVLCDADDRIVTWNERYLEMFPHLRPLIVRGLPFATLVEAASVVLWPDASPAQRKAWMHDSILSRRRTDHDYEVRMPDGRIIHAVARRTRADGTVTVLRDVTQERENSTELAHAKAIAEAANEAKGRFLATMSHEIRTPLNGVLGMNGLLLDTALSQEQRHYAETVRSSGEALLSVINDILDFSRLQAGRMELELAPFSPSSIIDAAASLLRVTAQAKGLTLETSLPDSLPAFLEGDYSRLRQVLFNLIGNAIKFTDTGGVRVEATHRVIGPDRVELEIVVRDTGIGIAPEVLPRLFDRFSQADSSTARRFGGSGLGLAISGEIAALMGGAITVESGLGQGSAFHVVVPFDLAEAPQPEPESSRMEATTAPVQGLRVLVAEDNSVNQLLIKAMLGTMGHSVDVVGDGIEAVEQVQRAPYDLVLMDIQMPRMDGEAATRAIRALAGPVARIPIIALTANAMAGHREIYLASGMDEYVPKPVDRKVLERAIAQVTADAAARGKTAGT